MVFRFSPKEVLTMAAELERRGIAFYEGLERKTQKQEGKKIFQFLADEEKRHLEIFSDLLGKVPEVFLDTDEEASRYLGAMVESGVLRRVLQGEVDVERLGISEALDIGIQVEKESILFYQGFLPFVVEEKRQWVETIIAEEKRHLVRLSTLKEEILGGTVSI
ncbi:MAG: ferritin family protein [Candidatus Caldatribacterium sp.]|uniref:ferritin family protein n=1 Tax=Candidatus Caldatribacterium sp. TaxID=2282143 RepID=UPI00299A2882|nr:ferritin family protein [Candidatus Caldatribacterium sp.]MCX7730651.1 ferritin family protein [Candidatus Caldatribacterium sp.]MDW8080405.1 ferritin family protein [Candidatus Calescibacterium sp.]